MQVAAWPVFLLNVILLKAQEDDISDKCPPAAKPMVLQAITGRAQMFLTPGYLRGLYRPGLDCHYVFQATSYSNKVQLTIEESRLEDRLFTECDDFVEVLDGHKNDSTSIIKWCGYSNPLSITSTTDSLYLRFKTDLFFESKGVNLTYTAYDLSGCPPNWTAISHLSSCYRLVSPRPNVTWVQAQYHCNYERSNLLTVASLDEYQSVYKTFSSSKELPWIGMTDAQEEGKFENVDHSTAVWPKPCDSLDSHGACFPLFSSHENKDCLYLDFNQESSLYRVDDCRVERSFICKKKMDGTTVPYPPPEAAIKQGFLVAGSAFSPALVWLVVVAAVLILLIILVSFVKNRLKKKTRVTATDLENNAALIQGLNGTVPVNAATDNIANGGNKIKTGANFDKQMADDPTAIRQFILPNHGLNDSNGLVNGSSNGHVANGLGSNRVFTLPPIDKFERPNLCTLDNVSAISLDEFWHKLDSEKYQQYPLSERKPHV